MAQAISVIRLQRGLVARQHGSYRERVATQSAPAAAVDDTPTGADTTKLHGAPSKGEAICQDLLHRSSAVEEPLIGCDNCEHILGLYHLPGYKRILCKAQGIGKGNWRGR